MTLSNFPENAPVAYPVFYRTYSRITDGKRETWQDVCTRTIGGLAKLGKLTPEEIELIDRMQGELKCLTSGRWLWVGGTTWIENPANFSGGYNCTSTNIVDWRSFGLLMDLAMQGSGTGAVLEPKYIDQLPIICNRLEVSVVGTIGSTPKDKRREETEVKISGDKVEIFVGDSRRGWVKSYQTILELSTDDRFFGSVTVVVDISDIRPSGETLKGFGGVANPIKLPGLYQRCAHILNKAIGRKLTSVECCLLIDEAAVCVVAGNIRRCLPEDALVHTSKGLIPLKKIQVGDFVQTPIGYRKVLQKFDQGIQDIYEIETNATAFTATLNHRMAVLSDAKGTVTWKFVNALTPEDRLIHSTIVLPGTTTDLPPDQTAIRPQQSRTVKPLTVPNLTPEVAWLIGFTHGDGYVALGRNKHNKPYGRVEWAMSQLDQALTTQLQQKIDVALQQFGLSASHGSVKGENTAKTICSSIRLAEYFYQYIKKPNVPLEVPDFILQGTIEVRAAYLAGLMDSDGAVNNRPPHLVTSVYRSFVRQVGAVLSSLGIAGRVTIVHPQNSTWQVKHNLTIPALKDRYNAIIAPYSAKGRLREGLKMYGFTIPGTMMRETYTYSQMQSMGFQGSRLVDANYERYIAEGEVNLDIPVSVKNISYFDTVQTYDLEIEEAHCFFCNGYLTHNSAGIRQGDRFDDQFSLAKDNLWQQDENGNWRIDPDRDALRMSNHTRVFHQKPTLQETIDAVKKQYYSGEGAIQWAGEAIARSSSDLLHNFQVRQEFLIAYEKGQGKEWLKEIYPQLSIEEIDHRLQRYGLNPCGEIIMTNNHCNLAEVHLNRIDPQDRSSQTEAFTAGALSVASLLNHHFEEDRYRISRELDPIVGVSFTGLFDFFVHAFGVDWLRWWAEGRPENEQGKEYKAKESEYLNYWREVVHKVVWDYCDRHGLKRPNRCTTVQPSGTKSLLTNASPGWHPPKSARYIRRITCRKNDPVAMACLDYGYNIIPSQSDKDDRGNLLNDPFDPRCTEWLVEIPVEVPWANLPGADTIDISKFSALAQFDFYMQVQKYYTRHNTSATIELRENEIEPLAIRIYEAIKNDEGYISAALLARFDDLQTFPRLPFEPIDKPTYDRLIAEIPLRRKEQNFHQALAKYDRGEMTEAGPAGCDSDKCMFPEEKTNQ